MKVSEFRSKVIISVRFKMFKFYTELQFSKLSHEIIHPIFSIPEWPHKNSQDFFFSGREIDFWRNITFLVHIGVRKKMIWLRLRSPSKPLVKAKDQYFYFFKQDIIWSNFIAWKTMIKWSMICGLGRPVH